MSVSPTDARDERFSAPVSVAELTRRHAAVREKMKANKVDALLLQGSNSYVGGGYFRWFTGLSAGAGYPNTLLFPFEGLSTLVTHGPDGGVETSDGTDPARWGIGKCVTVANFPSISFLGGFDAIAVGREIKKAGYKRIGLVGAGAMYQAFGLGLRKQLAGIEVANAADAVDELRAIKSDEELGLIRQAAVAQDAIMGKLPELIKPGMRDYEVAAHAQFIGAYTGGEGGYVRVASGPGDRPPALRDRQQMGRTIRAGDVVMVQCETSGPGGYYVQIARPFFVGQTPPVELVNLFKVACDAQDLTLTMISKGAVGKDVLNTYNTFVRGRGLPEERSLHCHGQGYDFVERPTAHAEEKMMFDASNNITIRPSFVVDGASITVADNFILKPGSPERLHRTPRQIFLL